MNTLNTISQLLGLISIIAIIWLTVGAFRNKRMLWGIGILFAPFIPVLYLYLVFFWNFFPSGYHVFIYILWAVGLIAPMIATFYARKFWVDVKTPFLVYMTSFVLIAGVGLYDFSASGGWGRLRASQEVARGIAQKYLTEKDAWKLMNSNRGIIRSSVLRLKQKQEMDFMRESIIKAEGGF